jgi:hypothetical protein
MKRLILVLAAVAVSTSAFAQANGPVRQGGKCWANTDQRGFGFWDACADRTELAQRGRQTGITVTFDQPRTVAADNISNSAGGGGGGAGGGGGNGGR